MKNAKKNLLILFSLFIISCSNSSRENEHISDSFKTEKEISMASSSEEIAIMGNKQDALPVSSSAAKTNTSSNKKFIRTADLKFKVKQVSNATYAIESIVSKFSGYITSTKLKTKIDHSINTKIAPDTIEETIHYNVYNNITIRVPNYYLDTTLRALIPHIAFLNHRTITANDVTLDLLASELEEKRKLDYKKRLKQSIDRNGKKLKSIENAERELDVVNTAKDIAHLNQLKLENDINYSIIQLHIYQNPAVRKEIHIQSTTSPYQPDLTQQLITNIIFGWTVIVQLFLFLIQFWSLYLIATAIYFLVIYMKKKN